MVLIFTLYFLILIKASLISMNEGQTKITKFESQQRNNKNDFKNHRKNFQNLNGFNMITTINKSSQLNQQQQMKNEKDKQIIQTSTINPIYEYSEELNTAAEKDFNQRKNVLWDTCIKRDIIGKYPPNAWEFFISPGHGITWCNVFKAASSTWMYYFNILGKSILILNKT